MPYRPTTPEPLAQVLRQRMAEDRHTFRSLADLTRDHDQRGRGLSYTYLGNVAKGVEPSPEAIEMIAAALGVELATILEYRLARARSLLDPSVVGLERAAESLLLVEEVLGREPVSEPAAESLRVPGPPEGGVLEQLLQDGSPSQRDQSQPSTKRPASRRKRA